MRLGSWLVFAMLLLAPALAAAQWTSNRGYQLLQRVDDVLFGVDNLSLVILDRQHVAGSLVRVNVDQPHPLRGRTDFVADCSRPLQFAIVPGTSKGRPKPSQLEFAPAKVLDGSWFAAEFACESTRQPGRASRIARDLYERGGPPDTETVYCELQPDGSSETRYGVEVRFSEQSNAVAVNRQWLSSGQVDAEEVQFGSVGTWHVHRKDLHVRKTIGSGEMVFSGSCDRRPPPTPRR
jgi:hypothetical protein